MAIYALGDRVPEIDESAFVHPDAVVIGNVRIGPRSSIWPSTVLRGDFGRIEIGEATSVQDGAIIHSTKLLLTAVGSWSVIGHLAHLEGCLVDDRALIGVGSVVLHEVHVGTGATVGGGAVVTAGTDVPDGALALGIPAKVRLDASSADNITRMAQQYVDMIEEYRSGALRRLD